MANHLMIDIETLSTRLDAATISIGAVVFDSFTIKLDPHCIEPLKEDRALELVEKGATWLIQPEQNRHISGSTIMWWLEQEYSAKLALRGDKVNLHTALKLLSQYIKDSNCEYFWSHGVTFDLMILQNAYDQLRMSTPWSYRQIRDTRTLFSLVESDKYDSIWPNNPVKHHPLWDAACQAVAVQEAIKLIKKGF